MNKLPLSLLLCTSMAFVPVAAQMATLAEKAVMLHQAAEKMKQDLVNLHEMPELYKHIVELPEEGLSQELAALRKAAIDRNGLVPAVLLKAAAAELGMDQRSMSAHRAPNAYSHLTPALRRLIVSDYLKAPNINTEADNTTAIGSSVSGDVTIEVKASGNINLGTANSVHNIHIGDHDTPANIINIGGDASTTIFKGAIDMKTADLQVDTLKVDNTAQIGGDLTVYNSFEADPSNPDLVTTTPVFAVDSATGDTTIAGTLFVSSIDTAAAGSLTLGDTNATSVDISKSGVQTTVKGTLQVDEAATFSGLVSQPLNGASNTAANFVIWAGNAASLNFVNGVATLSVANLDTLTGGVVSMSAFQPTLAAGYDMPLAFTFTSSVAGQVTVTAYNALTHEAIGAVGNDTIKVDYVLFGVRSA